MKNTLFLITGASGSGKTTVMRSIMDNELVSFTTRKSRSGEVDGKDYIFISKEEFNHLLTNDGLMEQTEYSGQFYGLTRQEFETKIANGHVFFICDVNGMTQMKTLYDNCISIFIYAEKEDAIKQMKLRGDNEESINKRVNTYEDEISNMYQFDEVVVNRHGELEQTIEIVKDIIMEAVND
jgi:guanylate kinase